MSKDPATTNNIFAAPPCTYNIVIGLGAPMPVGSHKLVLGNAEEHITVDMKSGDVTLTPGLKNNVAAGLFWHALMHSIPQARAVFEAAFGAPPEGAARLAILRDVEQRIHDCYNMQRASAWPHCEGVARAELIVRAMIDEAYAAKR